MLESFREYLDRFKWEMYRLFEMASLNTKGTIPTFDEDDKDYYRYIYDYTKQHFPKVFDDSTLLRLLIQHAVTFRYGAESKGGILHNSEAVLSDAPVDHTFVLQKGGKVTIPGIPMKAKTLAEKVDAHGYNYTHPDFGYGNSMWGPLKEELAPQILRWLKTGIMPEDSWLGFRPRNKAVRKDASYEDTIRHVASKERGARKEKPDENAEKSMQEFNVDEEDKKFLDSVAERFTKLYGTHLGIAGKKKKKEEAPMLPGMGDDDPDLPTAEEMPEKIREAQESAFAVRYSNHYIGEKDGKFYVKGEFTDKGQGQMVGNINFLMGKKPIRLNNIHLNLPHLVQKFEAVRKIRNFVAKPFYEKGMDPVRKQINMVRVHKILQRFFTAEDEHLGPHAAKGYRANWGTAGTEKLRDPSFYKQISIDHDIFRKAGGKSTLGKPLVDESISAKCTWRKRIPAGIHQGKEIIVEDPVDEDIDLNRNILNMDFEKILFDDAKISFHQAVKLLANTRYARDPKFADWAKQPENIEDAISKVTGLLMTNKTGAEGYRRTSVRIQMGKTALEASPKKNPDSIPGMYEGRGRGAEKDDEINPYDQTADTGRGTGGGGDYTTHDEEEPQVTPSVRSPGEESPEQVAQRHAVVQPELQPIVTPSIADLKRIGVKPLVWMRLSRQDKINVLKSAGLPHPAR